MLICVVFSACTPKTPPPTDDRQCKIVLSESNYYTCTEYVKTVEKGGSVEFALRLAKGYNFADTSYGDYDVQVSAPNSSGERTALLTLNNVKYSSFVNVGTFEEQIYKVTVNSSPVFSCDESEKFVSAGENAQFTLFFKGDYTFKSASFVGLTGVVYNVTGIDSDVDTNNERKIVLTIENVQADTSVNVRGKRVETIIDDGPITLEPIDDLAVIGYALNGGEYIDGNSGSYYTINYPLVNFRRPNTSIGTDKIYRDGYTLTGWNTHADGSGQHIGLGSRAQVLKGQTLILYAEWAEWTDADLFDYVVIDYHDIPELYAEKQNNKLAKLEALATKEDKQKECAVITHYKGSDDEVLVIPEELDGYSVSAVATYTVGTGNTNIKTIIFPLTMKYVMGLAFISCEKLTEIFIYDSLFYIDYNAFGTYSPIETLHINAKLSPIYGYNESAQFANKLEMLMLHADEHADEKKTIFFGSCTTWYGIIAEDFGKATGRTAYNMGVEGDTCTLIQLDIIKQYMQADDTLIYMCDLGSPYLWGYNVSFDPRVYRMMEFNYDLLATVNMQRYSSVLASLNEYLTIKNRTLESGSYEDFYPYISQYGDLLKERGGEPPLGEYRIIYKQTLVQNRAFEQLKEIFQSFVDMDIDVYFGISTISDRGIAGKEEYVKDVNDYVVSSFNDRQLNIPATLVGDVEKSVLPVEYFYEIYRLTRKGAEYFTPLFIENFKAVEHKN